MFYEKTDDDTTNTVQITVQSAWRRSYSSSYFTAAQHPSGDTVMRINGQESPVVHFGDDTHEYLTDVRIIAYSEAEDWFLGEQVFTKTYPTPSMRGTPWVVTFKGCCRVDGIQNAGDGSFEMVMDVDLLLASRSQRIVTLPVVFTRVSSVAPSSFKLMTSDDPLSAAAPMWELGGTAGWEAHASVALDVTGTVTVRTTATAGLVHVLAHARDKQHGLRVPVDLIVNVTAATVPRPEFSGPTVTAFSNLKHARPGFPFTMEIEGFQAQGMTSYVGYTVGRMPDGMTLSTVRGRGTGPGQLASMTMTWTPCADQLGMVVVCVDIVNFEGVAATQRCLSLHVMPDEPPAIMVMANGMEIANNGETDMWYIGRHYTLSVVARDNNPLDTLTITPVCQDGSTTSCTLLPPTSMLSDAEHARVMVDGAEVAHASRELSFAPKHDHGGYAVTHCFAVTDACGQARCADQCPGNAQMMHTCVTIRVKRCEFVVRPGQELQSIAAIYRTDWLQLWSHNQQILHPDLDLSPGSAIHIGHQYFVQPYDKPADVAARFGMDAQSFRTLNADVSEAAMTQEACATIKECQDRGQSGETYQWCVLPNSCEGQSGSIYQEAFADQGWFASARDQGAP